MARSAVPYLRWKERDRVNTTPAITNIQQQASKELTIAEHAAAMRSGLDGSGDERLKLFMFCLVDVPYGISSNLLLADSTK